MPTPGWPPDLSGINPAPDDPDPILGDLAAGLHPPDHAGIYRALVALLAMAGTDPAGAATDLTASTICAAEMP